MYGTQRNWWQGREVQQKSWDGRPLPREWCLMFEANKTHIFRGPRCLEALRAFCVSNGIVACPTIPAKRNENIRWHIVSPKARAGRVR